MFCPKFLPIILGLLFIYNNSHSQDRFLKNGTFESTDVVKKQFIISNNKFLFIQIPSKSEHVLQCCDTLAYGSIKFNNDGYLELSTDTAIDKTSLYTTVKETENTSTDSLIFHIHSPIEKFHQGNKMKLNDLIYSVVLIADSGENNASNSQLNQSPDFSEGELRWKAKRRYRLVSFIIQISPTNELFVKQFFASHLRTVEYKIKNENANEFDIDIPNLSFEYISYQRFHGDYAKVIDSNKILWGGMEYIRKSETIQASK
jgi:hypothetical protein